MKAFDTINHVPGNREPGCYQRYGTGQDQSRGQELIPEDDYIGLLVTLLHMKSKLLPGKQLRYAVSHMMMTRA